MRMLDMDKLNYSETHAQYYMPFFTFHKRSVKFR